jgi:hypothetical protein
MALAAIAGTASAASLSPHFDTLSPPSADLPRTGDFDGDGRTDQLVLVAEPDDGRVAVHVELNTVDGVKDVRVTSFAAGHDVGPDLRIVAAGAYVGDCGSFSTDCESHVTAAHDSLMLGLAGGASLLIHWQATGKDAGHFVEDFVRSDEAMMAHALAALYAANP